MALWYRIPASNRGLPLFLLPAAVAALLALGCAGSFSDGARGWQRVAQPQLLADQGSDVQSYQRTDIPLHNGTSQPLSFLLPEAAHSFVLTIHGDSESQDNHYYDLIFLDNPRGQPLVTDRPTKSRHLDPNPVYARARTATLLAPNNAQVAHLIVPGRYRFAIRSFTIEPGQQPQPAQGRVNLVLTVRRRQIRRGQLNITLHSSHSTISELHSLESGLNKILSQAGITATPLSHRSYPKKHSAAVTNMVTGNHMAVLESISPSDPNALNVYFVDGLRSGKSGRHLLGVSGGTPGAAFATDKAPLAVVVALTSGDTTPRVVAHEIAHYLGLYHSQEVSFWRTVKDPIADNDGSESQNLMYHDSSRQGYRLTQEQGFVLRGHPIVREF